MKTLLAWLACLPVALAAEPAKIDFNRDVRPIIFDKCVACHGPDEKERKGKLRLDEREGAIESGAINISKPAESAILERIHSEDVNEVMPPPRTGKKVTPREAEILKQWISEGAKYSTHWSYTAPKRPELPKVSEATWAKNGIDHFILARLDREKIKPQPEADKATILRRVALDITGLPPTVAEVDEFLKDTSPQAYEKMVDRYLAKPAYGEHWARMWLDLARYADSAGYADDPSRTIWAYRDWVIRAYNRNLPYDQFSIEQLAGDLLPNATEDQKLATAFHRNTLTNNEGGTSDEEFRNVAVVDRTNTTMAVWMGTSMACAQCHTHKYDPITQTEYFQFLAFFNNTADADRRDESPLLPVGDTPEMKQKREALEATAKSLEAQMKNRDPALQAILKIRANKARAEIGKHKAATTVPIMEELPAHARRVTKLQYRGNFMDLGPVVTEGTPKAFPALPKGAALNRLTMAKWIMNPQNPLTARVAVNRYWEALFGNGLVRTSEEFGSQGEAPVNPELLDWLAVEFVDSGWDMKKLVRLMVTSAAYRQSSKVTPELLQLDPENRFASRGPRFRLTAEMVRDQALAVSGLLSAKMYGPSVKPPQPSSGLNAAFGGGLDWQTSAGEDKYRRGLYTEWRRTSPYPSMMAFDATSREACTIRRNRSNTPMQALVTLNDPVYVEAAVALARLGLKANGDDTAKLNALFRQATSRLPTDAEANRLLALLKKAQAKYSADPALTKAFLPDATPDLAAWSLVGSVVLNLDEMLMKR
ncbi:MAG: PSD1 and planctomycete cytochrome C domain-containing protein [Fimbriiglobus sp.]